MTEPTLPDSFPNQTLSDTHTNLKSLIVQKLSRTTSEISPLKLIHSATLPSKKFINLQRTASTGINQAQVASNLISVDQSDDSLKVMKGNRMKRSMSSTMSHFKNRSSTMSPDSPLLNQAHSRSPNKKRNLTSAIKILPTTMNESRLSARGSPYRGSPLGGSPSNKSKDEATSAAVMKVQEIITGCSKLTQESPRSPVRVKAKVKEEEEEQKTGTRFDFWKKDETFLEERAKMRAELDKHKEKTLPREKGWELLEEGKKNNNIDEEEEEKERYINEKERLGQNNEMMKFILQKPRTFCVKTIPAATKKALRLQQGLLHPVENKITEEDRSAEKTEPDQGKMMPRAMTASPGLRRDEEKVQTNEKKLRSTMRERSNDSGFIRPDELEGASSSLLIRKVSELQKQPSRSVERGQGKFGRVKSELLKKPSVILEEKLTRWNEKVEVSPKQMTSFLAHKRGDYRKRVMPIHQLYKSSSLMKMLTG